MSERGERLQDAIGLVADEFVEEAHAEGGEGAGEPGAIATAEGADALASVAGDGAAGAVGEGREGASESAKPQAKRGGLRKRVIAVAACLVVLIGVGALAFGAMQPIAGMTPDRTVDAGKAESARGETSATEKADAGAASPSTYSLKGMATDAEAASDGAAASAVSAAGAAGAAGAREAAPGASTVAEPTADVDVATSSSSLSAGEIAGEGREVIDGGIPYDEGEAFVLTAAEWNDNANWPFFTNLVNAGTIGFPSFGLDPRNRVKVTVTDAGGNPQRSVEVTLRDGAGGALWHARSGKDGVAYLFYREGEQPASVEAGGNSQSLSIRESNGQQGASAVRRLDDVTIALGGSEAPAPDGLQVMFIVDTTGSMSDEIAYLQKDFASIAGEVGTDGVTYSVNFYRDEGEGEEYVTKCNGFTSDIAQVQRLLNDEYADGGGDEPEAVAQVLAETITDNGQWRESSAKVAFLVFDAPPHDGTDAAIDAAVRTAAEKGIRLVPVVSSNASRDTELFGRALAICTDGTYVFLTDDSGVGDAHLEPIVGDYTVELLHDVIVRIIRESA